jgi:hypothetical protein
MHVGDRQGDPFLAATAAPYLAAFRKGLVDRVHPDLVFSLPVITHSARTVVGGSNSNFYTLMILRNDKASVRRYGYSGDSLQ